jgi:hypothetical protein
VAVATLVILAIVFHQGSRMGFVNWSVRGVYLFLSGE